MDIFQPPPFLAFPGQNGSCRVDPVPLHSPGIWDLLEMKAFLSFPLPRLQSQLAVIFLLTQSLHTLLKRFHLPRVASEILAGLILGPTILGRLIPGFTKTLFPPEGDIFLNVLAKIGYMFFMFLSGVKMNPRMVKQFRKKAWNIGVLSVIIPVAVGLSVSPPISNMVSWTKTPGIRFVIATQTLSPFPVVAHLLIDLQIMNSELGHLALASALIRDLMSLIITAVTTYLRVGSLGSMAVGFEAHFLFLASVCTIGFVARAGFLWIIRQTPEGKPVKGIHLTFIPFAVLVSAIIGDNVGILYHYGPFLLGLAVPDGPPLGSTLEERFDTMVSGLFAPLLLTYCGLQSDLFEVYDLRYQSILWTVLFGGTAVKFAANCVPALFCKMPVKDAIALSLILSTQGIVELAGFLAYHENDTLDNQTFSTVTASVFLTTIVIPLLVRSIYDSSRRYGGYQKRNILHSPDNAELKILACAHRPDDAMATLKLLQASSTKDSPIAIFALHLMELVGRASPLLINHQLGQKASSGSGSRSQQTIELFQKFEQQNSGSVHTQTFTAISLPKFMHEDICSLAFEKLASIIIVPFHRKWNPQGKVIFDDNVSRSINRHVLHMAPCSVGILIDRRKIHQSSSSTTPLPSAYRMAVIYLGGDDDREALAYAKRMAGSPEINLTVVRFFYKDELGDLDNWETMLDAEALKDMRLTSSQKGNVRFREEKVKDGAELALRIHSMQEVYDLIIVGRSHPADSPMLSGLTEWTELPELGALGDFLASADINIPVSVLVVQQQLHVTK